MLRALLVGASTHLHTILAANPDVTITARVQTMRDARDQLVRANYQAVFLDSGTGGAPTLNLLPLVSRHAHVAVVVGEGDKAGPLLEAAGIACLREPVEAVAVACLLSRFWATSRPPPPHIVLRAGSTPRLLPLDEIRLVAACENYTEVVHAAGERLLVRRTMRQWADQLPELQFARVHRSLFVNLDHVARTPHSGREVIHLHFKGEAAGPCRVRRRHWPRLRDRLELWRHSRPARDRPDHPPLAIAVLPFATPSRYRDDEIFCDGLCDDLINLLSRIPQLRVAARSSAFYFKGRSLTAPEIGQLLGVDYLLEGSVRIGDQHVCLQAQLVNAANGFQVWANSFECESAELPVLQDQIVGGLASGLQLKLDDLGRGTPVVDPDTNWLVLEGRHFWNLRTHDSLARAESAFFRATIRSPRHAAAHLGLAEVFVVRAMYRLADGAPAATEDLQSARQAANRALACDPSLGEAHAVLGFTLFHEGHLAAATRKFPRAFALNPNHATGYQFYAWTLCGLGRMEQALQEYRKAIVRDPLSFINLDRHAAMLALARRFPEALAESERAASLRPDVFVGNLSQRAAILLALGRREEALAAARVIRQSARAEAYRRNADADAIFVLRQCGKRNEADAYADEMLARFTPRNYLRGFVLAAIGRFDAALPFLESVPPIMLPQLYWSELFEPIRDKAVFRRLIARLGRKDEFATARAFARSQPKRSFLE